jgi:hypothetical protein
MVVPVKVLKTLVDQIVMVVLFLENDITQWNSTLFKI